MKATTRKRRWWQFESRGLFVATLAIAVYLAVWRASAVHGAKLMHDRIGVAESAAWSPCPFVIEIREPVPGLGMACSAYMCLIGEPVCIGNWGEFHR